MILTFDKPKKLTDHFDVAIDTTTWEAKTDRSGNQFYYEKYKEVSVPTRKIASFNTFSNAIKLKSDLQLPSSGLFLLAFDIPYQAMFIGLAANEDMFARMQKYQTNIIGSNLGNIIHHPQKWQDFARKRFEHFELLGKPDECSDVRFSIGQITSQETQFKKALEHFRWRITEIKEHYEAIASILWDVESVTILNSQSAKGDNFAGSIILWGGNTLEFLELSATGKK
jgi:hypothetical protein